MCLICVEMQKNKMTAGEAWSNFLEMREDISEKHAKDLEGLVSEYITKKFREERNESKIS